MYIQMVHQSYLSSYRYYISIFLYINVFKWYINMYAPIILSVYRWYTNGNTCLCKARMLACQVINHLGLQMVLVQDGFNTRSDSMVHRDINCADNTKQ